MGLFDQVLDAVNSPSRTGNPGQLSSILGMVQQLSGQFGTNPSTMESLVSVVGGHVRSSLQRQREAGSNETARGIVERYGDTNPNPDAVQALFNPQEQQQLTDTASRRTGLDVGLIQQLLPAIVPLVLNFLKAGSQAQGSQTGGNSVLNAFLDADRDGDVDLADVMKLAGRHFGR